MSTEKEFCDKCGKEKKKDHKCKGMPKGSYGLGLRFSNEEDKDEADIVTAGEGGDGGVSEEIKMPRAPQDTDRGMKGMSKQKKEKKMSEFKAAADEAKKRQSDKKRSDELYHERRTKGVRFYDAKGSGYIKGGKKHYD